MHVFKLPSTQIHRKIRPINAAVPVVIHPYLWSYFVLKPEYLIFIPEIIRFEYRPENRVL